jgi:hypothetical protein
MMPCTQTLVALLAVICALQIGVEGDVNCVRNGCAASYIFPLKCPQRANELRAFDPSDDCDDDETSNGCCRVDKCCRGEPGIRSLMQPFLELFTAILSLTPAGEHCASR